MIPYSVIVWKPLKNYTIFCKHLVDFIECRGSVRVDLDGIKRFARCPPRPTVVHRVQWFTSGDSAGFPKAPSATKGSGRIKGRLGSRLYFPDAASPRPQTLSQNPSPRPRHSPLDRPKAAQPMYPVTLCCEIGGCKSVRQVTGVPCPSGHAAQ